MKSQFSVIAGLTAFVLAMLILMHWIFICTPEELLHLYKKGFRPDTLNALPSFLKPIYKGTPNLISLISLILFTFAAFLFMGPKRKIYSYLSIVSFVLIAYLFLFLLKI